MSAHHTHRPTEREIMDLYTPVAREEADEWVRKLVGVDRPVSAQEAQQALGDLFDGWADPTHAHRPTREE